MTEELRLIREWVIELANKKFRGKRQKQKRFSKEEIN